MASDLNLNNFLFSSTIFTGGAWMKMSLNKECLIFVVYSIPQKKSLAA